MNRPCRRLQAALGAAFFMTCGLAAAQSAAPAPWEAQPTSLLPSRFPVLGTDRWVVAATASQFSGADAIPVRDLDGSWDGYRPKAGTNVALESARADLSVSRSSWEVAAVARADIRVIGSRSSWDAVHVYKQRADPASGSVYAIDAHDDGLLWAGLRAAHTWVLRDGTDNGLELTMAASLLSVQRVQETSAAGRIGYTAQGGYAFQVDALQQDSHKQFGGYGRRGTTGRGATTDLGLLWSPTSTTFVNVSVSDLLSRLRTRDVSTKQATLSSSTNSVGSDGYLAYQPLVQGRYSGQDIRTTLDRQWSASAGTALSVAGRDLMAGVRFERVADIGLPALWATVPLSGGVSLLVDAELRFRSAGIGLQTRYGSFMMRTQSTDLADSRALGVQASFRMPV